MLKLALGPLSYYWSRDEVFSFYEAMSESAIDIVYLGETICSRRHELKLSDWADIAAMLQKSDKQVVMSSQVLLESMADVKAMQRLFECEFDLFEANDMGALARASAGGHRFVAGPHLNAFSPPVLEQFARQGAVRWVMPVEMSKLGLKAMLAGVPAGLETEVFGYGRLPLAYSARCFTARHHNVPKDQCGFACLQYPNGLSLKTREQQDFLTINGIQTQSDSVYNLLTEVPEMQAIGVDVLRLSPQHRHMAEIIALFDQVRREEKSLTLANQEIRRWMPAPPCEGYWFGKPGIDQVQEVQSFPA